MAPLRLAPLRLAALAGSALIAAGFRPAEAASFACARATGPVETAICSDTGLSRLDERLASAYSAAARKLGLTLASRNGVPDAQAIAPLRESSAPGSRNATVAVAMCRACAGNTSAASRCSASARTPTRQARPTASPDATRTGASPGAPSFAWRRTAPWSASTTPNRPRGDGSASSRASAAGGDGARLVATYDGEPGYTLSISPRGLTIDDDTGGGMWCGMGGAIHSPSGASGDTQPLIGRRA